jgi:hypothetical protein
MRVVRVELVMVVRRRKRRRNVVVVGVLLRPLMLMTMRKEVGVL